MLRAGLSELSAFVAIAENRSFRLAANILGVSPSALSHAMRNLEDRLNVRLLNRTTRSVALTEAGERLFNRVRPAIADLEGAVSDALSTQSRPSGRVRISASEASARPLIHHVLPAFLLAYPDIHIEFVVETRFVDIVEMGLDAGIRVYEDVPKDMVAVLFSPELRFILLASKEYLSRCGRPEVPDDLKQHHCIAFKFASGAPSPWTLLQDGKLVEVPVNGPITVGNWHLAVHAALAGIGIALVPDSYALEYVESGRLITVMEESSTSIPGLCLYYPANRHLPPAMRLFVDAVRAWSSDFV
jgi:DNA-binding transcriptional LysR family regulator